MTARKPSWRVLLALVAVLGPRPPERRFLRQLLEWSRIDGGGRHAD